MIVKRTSDGDLVVFVANSGTGRLVERLLSTFDGWRDARAEDFVIIRQELHELGGYAEMGKEARKDVQ